MNIAYQKNGCSSVIIYLKNVFYVILHTRYAEVRVLKLMYILIVLEYKVFKYNYDTTLIFFPSNTLC